eukprot:357404-Chlamydomonas_euryale.AAC.2
MAASRKRVHEPWQPLETGSMNPGSCAHVSHPQKKKRAWIFKSRRSVPGRTTGSRIAPAAGQQGLCTQAYRLCQTALKALQDRPKGFTRLPEKLDVTALKATAWTHTASLRAGAVHPAGAHAPPLQGIPGWGAAFAVNFKAFLVGEPPSPSAGDGPCCRVAARLRSSVVS